MYGRHLPYALLTALLLALAFPGAAHAEQPPCVSLIPFNTPVGCIYAHLEPGTLTGDLDIISHTSSNGVSATGTLTITGINYSALNYSTDQSGMSFMYRFYNIQESGNPDFGTWYTYKEMTKTVTVPGGGQVKDIPFKPAKSYIRGKVELTCDIKNFKGEDVSCMVMVDGAARGALAPGGKTTFVLDPGPHAVEVDLAGSQTNLWAPGKFTKTLNVRAGATIARVSASFSKAAHLKVILDQPGVVGDFHLNGVRVATQVATYDQWVTGNKSYKIEVKNLTDPALGPGVWVLTRPANVHPAPGAEQTVTLKLKSAPLDIKALIGTWKGVANSSWGAQFLIGFKFTSYPPCTYGGVCGTFELTGIACSGQVRMISLVNNVYTWVNANATGAGCASPGSGIDTLTLNTDGTVRYHFASANGGWADGTLLKAQTPVDIKALIGTWTGTATGSDGMQFLISFTFKSSPLCVAGGVCGTFSVPAYNCSGQVRMISLVNSVYTWENAHATSGCAPPGSGIDTLTLNTDGTVRYHFARFSGGWAEGILTKNAP